MTVVIIVVLLANGAGMLVAAVASADHHVPAIMHLPPSYSAILVVSLAALFAVVVFLVLSTITGRITKVGLLTALVLGVGVIFPFSFILGPTSGIVAGAVIGGAAFKLQASTRAATADHT